jgi:hypothetical protein
MADLKFFELHVLSFEIWCIPHEDDRIPLSSRPFSVDTMVACIFDNPVENVIGRHRKNTGANLFECQLDRIPTRDAGSGHDGDHRLDPTLFQQEGESNPVELEEDARFVNLRRELVGKMSHEIFGQPRVDFLVREDGLPVRLIADVIAELKALRHELLGLPGSFFTRQKNDVAIIGGLVRQRKPADYWNRGNDTETESDPEQPSADFVHRTSRSLVEGDATLENDQGSRAASRGVDWEGLKQRRGRTVNELYVLLSNRSTLALKTAHRFTRSSIGRHSPLGHPISRVAC